MVSRLEGTTTNDHNGDYSDGDKRLQCDYWRSHERSQPTPATESPTESQPNGTNKPPSARTRHTGRANMCSSTPVGPSHLGSVTSRQCWRFAIVGERRLVLHRGVALSPPTTHPQHWQRCQATTATGAATRHHQRHRFGYITDVTGATHTPIATTTHIVDVPQAPFAASRSQSRRPAATWLWTDPT